MNFSALFSNIEAIAFVVLFFGGSIFVHELGHFLAARRRGLVVERFSIGFGPRILSWSRNGVEYCISLFPLGGYVALPQLGDLEAVEGKYTIPIKGLSPVSYADRLIVLSMGAVFNLIFALFLSIVLWLVGQPMPVEDATCTIGYVLPTIQIDEDLEVSGPAYKAGLQPGDKIISVDGMVVRHFSDIEQYLVTGFHKNDQGEPEAILEIERNGQQQTVTLNPALVLANATSGDYMRVAGIVPAHPVKIAAVMPHSPAEKAGLQPGDVITQLNGAPLYAMHALSNYIQAHPAQPVHLTFLRAGKPYEIWIQPATVVIAQPTLELKAQEDLAARLTLVPLLPASTKNTTAITITDSIAGLAIYNLQEGSQGSRFKNLSIGDRIIGHGGALPLRSMEEATDAVNAMKVPALMVQSKDHGTFIWSTPSQLTAELKAPKTQIMLGFVRDTTPVIVHLTPWEQFSHSITTTLRVLTSLFRRDSDVGVGNLMGPPGILRVLHTFSTIDLRLVMAFTLLLNINLAILNLLPIPVLDGGQILFATINRLRHNPIPIAWLGRVQTVFMILLFSLMIYVSFCDVRRWQGDNALDGKMEVQSLYYLSPHF